MKGVKRLAKVARGYCPDGQGPLHETSYEYRGWTIRVGLKKAYRNGYCAWDGWVRKRFCTVTHPDAGRQRLIWTRPKTIADAVRAIDVAEQRYDKTMEVRS